MAHITIAAETPEEATLIQRCIDRFTLDEADALITAWLRSHAAAFRREDLEVLLNASDADADIKISLDTLIARAVTATRATGVVTLPTPPSGVDPKVP